MDQGLVYRPALDFPTWSFAAARRTELKGWTLSPSDKGAVENSSIASSAEMENEFQSAFLVCQRTLRWDAEAAGTSHLMVVVMGRWSEPRSSPTVHSFPVDQALLTAVMSGVLRPPVPRFTHVAVPSLRMLAFCERGHSSTNSTR